MLHLSEKARPAMPMSFSAASVPAEETPQLLSKDALRRQRMIAWSSFTLALLQSICGAVVAIDGLRLAIGIGSLALSAGVGAALVRFHVDFIRIPMLAVALLGAVFNLAVLFHMRQLRRRPSAQWRLKPLSSGQRKMQRLQVILSLFTLALIGVEEYLHFGFHHSL